MKIVAFLQNMWFKDPARGAARLLEQYKRHEDNEESGRERFIRDMLFMGCLTGKRLLKVFGEELCSYGGIVWEESSKGFAGSPKTVLPPDPVHVLEVLEGHKPEVILLFGKIAEAGYNGARRLKPKAYIGHVIKGPHPAARGPGVIAELERMASELRCFVAADEAITRSPSR